MTTEVTRKQAILLSVLCAILVIILFWQFLISPQIKSASKAKEDLETLNQQYSDLLVQSESYDQNMAALDGWNEKNSEETKKLFPLSDAERIDRFLTFVMHECGVTVNGLSIGQTMQYYIDGEGNLVTASPDDVANSSGSDSSGSETDAVRRLIHQRVSIAVTYVYHGRQLPQHETDAGFCKPGILPGNHRILFQQCGKAGNCRSRRHDDRNRG